MTTPDASHVAALDPGRGGSASENVAELRASLQRAIAAASNAYRDTTRLIRCLTVLGQRGELDDLLDRTLGAISELFDVDIAVLLVPYQQDQLRLLGQCGLDEETAALHALWPAVGQLQHAMAARRANCSSDLSGLPTAVGDLGVQQIAWLPFGTEEETSLLGLLRCRDQPFLRSELETLEPIVHRLGIAVDQARHTKRIEQLSRLGRAVSCHLDLDEVLRAALATLPEIFDADEATAAVISEDGIARFPDYVSPDCRGLEVPLERLASFESLKRGQAYRTPDYKADGGYQREEWAPRAVLAVPVPGRERLLGIVYLVRSCERPFSAVAADAAMLFAAQLGAAVENAWLYGVLRKTATHDELTGLPNRRLLLERLREALQGAEGEPSQRDVPTDRPDARGAAGSRVGLLFLDLDRFKAINDTLGHAAGDELLVEAARRIRSCLREDDVLARLGGDEFVVLARGVHDRSQLDCIAERILDVLTEPIIVRGRKFVVSASIGVVIAEGSATEHDLLRHADAAMYQAKNRGRARWAVYDAELDAVAQRRVQLEGDLRAALARDELRLVYHPVLTVDGRLVAAEALLRWEHPTRGMVSPLEFIGLAEESGLIRPIGQWALREACRAARHWGEIRAAKGLPPLRVSVNVSAYQLESGFANSVASILAETGLEPRRLVVEVTESAYMDSASHAPEILAELRKHGVLIAIDDFGTGYSSFERLRRFPIDIIKVDRSLVSGIDSSSTDAAIVGGIVQLGHALDAAVVAEGVERTSQLAVLRQLGCEHAQGFLFSRPCPDEQFLELVRTTRGGRRRARVPRPRPGVEAAPGKPARRASRAG